MLRIQHGTHIEGSRNRACIFRDCGCQLLGERTRQRTAVGEAKSRIIVEPVAQRDARQNVYVCAPSLHAQACAGVNVCGVNSCRENCVPSKRMPPTSVNRLKSIVFIKYPAVTRSTRSKFAGLDPYVLLALGSRVKLPGLALTNEVILSQLAKGPKG